MNEKHFFISCIILFLLLGYSTAANKADIFSPEKQAEISAFGELIKEHEPQLSILPEPERLVYRAKYLGITIGKFEITNMGTVMLHGQEVYCFELRVKTLPFFSTIFKTKDRYVTYMDKSALVVVRHEEYIKGGGLLESTVDFDYIQQVATFKNHLNNEQSKVKIPQKLQDILSGGYFLRMLPLELGDTAELNIYADGKIYQYSGLLASKTKVNLPHQRGQEAHVFQPSLFLDGKQVKKLTAEIFFSTTAPTQTLRASLKTRFGSVHVVLVEGYTEI